MVLLCLLPFHLKGSLEELLKKFFGDLRLGKVYQCFYICPKPLNFQSSYQLTLLQIMAAISNFQCRYYWIIVYFFVNNYTKKNTPITYMPALISPLPLLRALPLFICQKADTDYLYAIKSRTYVQRQRYIFLINPTI